MDTRPGVDQWVRLGFEGPRPRVWERAERRLWPSGPRVRKACLGMKPQRRKEKGGVWRDPLLTAPAWTKEPHQNLKACRHVC